MKTFFDFQKKKNRKKCVHPRAVEFFCPNSVFVDLIGPTQPRKIQFGSLSKSLNTTIVESLILQSSFYKKKSNFSLY